MRLDGRTHRVLDAMFRDKTKRATVKAALASYAAQPAKVAVFMEAPDKEVKLDDHHLVLTEHAVGIGWPMTTTIWSRDA